MRALQRTATQILTVFDIETESSYTANHILDKNCRSVMMEAMAGSMRLWRSISYRIYQQSDQIVTRRCCSRMCAIELPTGRLTTDKCDARRVFDFGY
ncbi:hypothetical protein KP509_03G073100 [Ceratopteris richardii]|uniref:Uncharacterized protein n=1 Tax=Ceratopteris richardii TaxID=49495 RepID=A0A8T2V8W6_CERRI|nr:hypothetical protein KP509_03G073100 [Ceratopteris richardii]